MIRVGEINKFCDENSKILEQSTFICSYVNKIFHSSVPFSVFIWWFAFFRYEKRDIFPDYKKLIIKQITLCVYMIKLLQFDKKPKRADASVCGIQLSAIKKLLTFLLFRRSNSPSVFSSIELMETSGELRLNKILKIDRLKNILYFWVNYRRCNVICFEYLRKITC